MSGISPESQILLKLLEDGHWHPRAVIHEKLRAAVAPGKALRRYEQIEKGRAEAYGPRKGPPLSEDQQIDSGRRSIASDTINSMKKRYIEVIDTDDGRMLRRRPEPLPIADYRTPAPMRAAPAPDPPQDVPAVPPQVAFFSEAQIRQILTEVVEDVATHVVNQALDRFQRGMRGFLLGRFADLERLMPADLSRRHRTQQQQRRN